MHRLGGYYPGTLAKITTLCGTEGIDIQRMNFFRPDENPIQLQDELAPATKEKPHKGRPRCQECRVDEIEVDRLVRTGLALQERRRKGGH